MTIAVCFSTFSKPPDSPDVSYPVCEGMTKPCMEAPSKLPDTGPGLSVCDVEWTGPALSLSPQNFLTVGAKAMPTLVLLMSPLMLASL